MPKRVAFGGFALDLELPSNVDTEIGAGRWFDPDVTAWINAYVKPGMVCIDAGANWGLFTLLMARKVSITGKVFAFEPSTDFWKRLKAYLELNEIANAEAIHVALGNKTGDVICTKQGPPLYSSANVHFDRVDIQCERDEIAQADTLDHWWGSRDCTLDFIKIDVDGSELQLLLGAEKTIEKHRPVMAFEIPYDEIGVNASKWLTDRGYSLVTFKGNKVDHSYIRSQADRGAEAGAGTENLLALSE